MKKFKGMMYLWTINLYALFNYILIRQKCESSMKKKMPNLHPAKSAAIYVSKGI